MSFELSSFSFCPLNFSNGPLNFKIVPGPMQNTDLIIQRTRARTTHQLGQTSNTRARHTGVVKHRTRTQYGSSHALHKCTTAQGNREADWHHSHPRVKSCNSITAFCVGQSLTWVTLHCRHIAPVIDALKPRCLFRQTIYRLSRQPQLSFVPVGPAGGRRSGRRAFLASVG